MGRPKLAAGIAPMRRFDLGVRRKRIEFVQSGDGLRARTWRGWRGDERPRFRQRNRAAGSVIVAFDAGESVDMDEGLRPRIRREMHDRKNEERPGPGGSIPLYPAPERSRTL